VRVFVAAVAAVVLCVTLVSVSEAARFSKGERSHMRRVVAPHRAWLERVAWCESRSDWRINTGNGFYGGLQFAVSSWRAVGGMGFPHEASKLEQMYRGVLLLRRQGPGAWPVCSRMAG